MPAYRQIIAPPLPDTQRGGPVGTALGTIVRLQSSVFIAHGARGTTAGTSLAVIAALVLVVAVLCF